ncbi:MAG: endopeptidase La [Thermodesulfobacteria bacterium]|nr:endopeptidase La [Thermodesulfobacteriota bacterium]
MKFDATVTDLFDLDIPESYEIPECLPLMALRDVIVFPSMVVPLFVGRESSIAAVNEALTNDRLIYLVAQKDARIDKPGADDLYQTGVIAAIMRTLQLPDGRLKILTQALLKGRTLEVVQEQPFFKVKVEPIEDEEVEISVETEALMRHVREQAEKLFNIKNIFSPELGIILSTVNDPGKLADVVASNLKLNGAEAQEILQLFHPIERLKKVSEFLAREIEVSAVQAKIQSEAREEMSRTQRDIFLREQLRAIQRELGEIDERQKEIEEYKSRITKALMPEHAEEEALKQLKRLEFMHPDSSEAALVRTYLDWLCELPWSVTTRDKLDIKRARKILDEDHYDLEKIKERIIEFIAVRKLNRSVKGPILCFVGPPGVGKTSLGKSIARALGRKFVRLSLGGVRDEAEIRGHRRTYVGALPGRIIQEMKRAGTRNPVFMMDEVDKIGADFRGDPAAALLEVLDPEQNNAFSDHFIEIPFDLSKVLFILTANVIDTIPSALLDRLEVLRLSGYTPEEKREIAKRYLIERQMKECGLKPGQLEISDNALDRIISEYTEEAGLRELERQIAAICRKVACKVADGNSGPFRVTAGNLHKYLGPPKVLSDFIREDSQVGVATGLAWTAYGGEVMRIECQVMPGKGNLTLTGLLGDVMKESAQAALSWIKSRAKELNIRPEDFEEKDIHIHIPSGAIPKDGPSAGITLTTALVSAFTKRPVNKDVAMTGEITLTGRILPIGGLKEKSIAALRKGIPTIIIPENNLTDLEEIPEQIRKRLEFIPVVSVDQVLELALLPPDEKKSAKGEDS